MKATAFVLLLIIETIVAVVFSVMLFVKVVGG